MITFPFKKDRSSAPTICKSSVEWSFYNTEQKATSGLTVTFQYWIVEININKMRFSFFISYISYIFVNIKVDTLWVV